MYHSRNPKSVAQKNQVLNQQPYYCYLKALSTRLPWVGLIGLIKKIEPHALHWLRSLQIHATQVSKVNSVASSSHNKKVQVGPGSQTLSG